MMLGWGGLSDWACDVPPSQEIACACMVPKKHYNMNFATPVFVTLRGLCLNSHIDSIYYPVNWDDGSLGYAGFSKSSIVFNQTRKIWVITTQGVDTVAESNATDNSFAFGVQKWFVTKDEYRCNEEKFVLSKLQI